MNKIMNEVLRLDFNVLKELFEKAKVSERKRALQVLRSSDKGEIPAVIFDILLPGTYVRPHRHPQEDGREIWILISGRMKATIFNEDGSIKENYFLSANETVFIEIPARTYHTIIAFEPSVLCELYFGRYDPSTYKEFGVWAPEENDSNVQEYLEKMSQKIK